MKKCTHTFWCGAANPTATNIATKRSGSRNLHLGNGRVGLKPDHVIYDRNVIEIDDVDYIPDTPLVEYQRISYTMSRVQNCLIYVKALVWDWPMAAQAMITWLEIIVMQIGRGQRHRLFNFWKERDFHIVEWFYHWKFQSIYLTIHPCNLRYAVILGHVNRMNTNQNTNVLEMGWRVQVELRRQVISRLPELNRVTNNCSLSRDEGSFNRSLSNFVQIIREATDPLFP